MNKIILEEFILSLLITANTLKSGQISEQTGYSQRQVQRALNKLLLENKIKKIGDGKNSSYQISTFGRLFYTPTEADLSDTRLEKRDVVNFNFEIFETLAKADFSLFESQNLTDDLKKYQNKLAQIPDVLLDKEMQRLVVEFSWKSSQIEGNTFSLLETQQLLVEQNKPNNHSQQEIQMILNHKKALDYIFNNKSYFLEINWKKITEIHKLLLQDMQVSSDVRAFGVGITGSLYKPLDNQAEIKEVVDKLLNLINQKQPLEKSFLISLLLPYIQPFNDGNKRTARVLANAVLYSNDLPMLSFRSVNSADYLNSVVAFYALNSIKLYQDIFLGQILYFCKNYF